MKHLTNYKFIKDTGKHPRNKADGGRIGFKKGLDYLQGF
jgi:hypothetical protein